MGPAISTAFGAFVVLDDAGNALIRLLNSAPSARSALSASTRCSWEPSWPVAAPGEIRQPRVRRLLVGVAVPAARSFSAVVTRAGESRSSPSARGRMLRTAIARIICDRNESFVRGHKQIAFRRENNVAETEPEIVNRNGDYPLAISCNDDDIITGP